MNKKNANWMNEIQHSDLDLGVLTLPKFDCDLITEISRKQELEQAVYKKKYGENWFEKWWADRNPEPDYDIFMKMINTAIYNGKILEVCGFGGSIKKDCELVYNRMHEVYGDKYMELEVHAPGDPQAVELLLQDVIKSGKWKELPDCLQDEYHKRVNG